MGVSRTGLMTLYWKERARKKEFWEEVPVHGKATRTKPLFKDETMALLLDKESIEYAIKTLDPKLALAVAVRHKFFTKEISKSIKQSDQPTKQVVLLGSGYDTRPVRKRKYSSQHGVKFFEVDKKEVIDNKQRLYQQHQIQPNATMVSVDYIKEDLIEYLKTSGLDLSLPTHFIWEGNTFYHTKEQVEMILTKIKNAFSGQLLISFDYMHAKLNSVAEVGALKNALSKDNATMQSDVTDFRTEISEKLGFTIVNHRACSEMTQEYGVGESPYESQKSYYLCTLRK